MKLHSTNEANRCKSLLVFFASAEFLKGEKADKNSACTSTGINQELACRSNEYN